jgi:hypothetical protein
MNQYYSNASSQNLPNHQGTGGNGLQNLADQKNKQGFNPT